MESALAIFEGAKTLGPELTHLRRVYGRRILTSLQNFADRASCDEVSVDFAGTFWKA